MQPLAGADTSDRLVTSGRVGPQEPVNSDAFWRKKSEEVSAEDAFFHEYFSRIGKDTTRKGKKGERDPVDRDEEAAEELDENEEEIWKALVDSRPELEADEDSDDDLDMDDLESAMEDEDEGEGEGDGDDEDVVFNDESEDEDSRKEAKQPTAVSDEEDDTFDIDDSDEEAFVNSDEDVPMDADVGEAGLPNSEDKSGGKKKRKLKHLPTFASADDYAALLADEDEGI